MKQVIKKSLCTLLAVVLMLTAVPFSAFASEEDFSATPTEQDVDYQATSVLGQIISDAMDDSGVASTAENNYYIQDVTVVEPAYATAIVSAPDNATLVMAVYDEVTGEMLTSAMTAVSSETTTADIIFDDPILTEFFVIKAFLVDAENKPVCKNFESKKYTVAFQEFLAKTTEDFEEEVIVNLDESEETNFAVVAEEAVVVEQSTAVNVLVVNDFENGVYVFENATEEITSLVAGDIFYFEYGDGLEDYILTKIGTIENNKGTVTITTSDDYEISEFFSYIKIDTTELQNDVPQTYAMSRGFDDEAGDFEQSSSSISLKFATEFDLLPHETLEFSGTVNVTTTLQFYYDFKLFGEDYYEITSKLDLVAEGAVEIEIGGKKTFEPIILCQGYIPIMTGIEATFLMRIAIEFESKVTAKGSFEYSITFGAKKIAGRPDEDLSKKGEFKLKAAIEGEVSFSIIPSVTLGIRVLRVFGIDGSYNVAFKITGVAKIMEAESGNQASPYPDEIHRCFLCFDGDVTLSNSLEFNVNFGLLEKHRKKIMKLSYTLNSVKLCDFYVQINDVGEIVSFGLTPCPHAQYKTTFKVLDENGNPVSGVELVDDSGTFSTESNGEVIRYNNTGTHSVFVRSSNYILDKSKNKNNPITFAVNSAPVVVKIYVKKITSESGNSNIVESGIWEDRILWTLYTDGSLVIEGEGDLPGDLLGLLSQAPWMHDYDTFIKKITIRDGITGIGAGVFLNCLNLTDITIPNSVTSIGMRAFAGCESLSKITIPNGVNFLGRSVFIGCKNLKTIIIGKGLKNVTGMSFINCAAKLTVSTSNPYLCVADGVLYSKDKTELIYDAASRNNTSYTIPNSVTSISDGAFYGCSNLTSITMPSKLTTIGLYAFYGCSGLTSIAIPSSVTTIDSYAFYGCSGLKNITIPNSVTSIGGSAFEDCSNLTSVKISSNVTAIRQSTFERCSNLTSVTIPNKVTIIGQGAFRFCSQLKSITIPSSVTTIEHAAFGFCDNLSTVYYGGTASQWKKIELSTNDVLTEATIVYSSKSTEPLVANFEIDDNAATYSETSALTETITDAVVGYEYIIVAVRDENAEELIVPVNLLFIDQKTAEAEELTFEYYIDESISDYDVLIFGQEPPHYHRYIGTATPATCTQQGFTTYTCECEDFYVADYVDASGHDYQSAITIPATHLTVGEETFTCLCGDSYTQSIAKSEAHSYSTVITAPTCTAQGYTTYTCECGDSYVGDYSNALGHTEEVIPGKAATCTATGLTDGKKCTLCGEITLAQTEIAKLEHSKVTVNQKAATATEDGYTGDVVCSVCGTEISKGKVIPATGNTVKNCDHLCHKDGFIGFIWKIVQFFWKLFGMNPVCECGVAHY
ncbi:MAG: leucine-rich repeat domain-containing protein [Ruminococcaceae bacterium]|nr:leucine-rich repeat domain-containing protein [Oscillospiraceae bacterium]